MRLSTHVVTAFLLAVSTGAASPSETDSRQLGEALGYYLWKDYQHLEVCKVLPEDIIRGVQKAERGEEVALDRTELHDYCIELYRDYASQLQQSNLAKSEATLGSLAKQSGFQVLEDGKLVVELLSPGTGREVNNAGLFHLQARFGEDLILDTQASAQPAKQELDQAIEGFEKGVKGMREGERRRLYIHPKLAYGVTEIRHPNELLILEVELLESLDESSLLSQQ